MVIGLYPPIHIDETNLPAMKFLLNQYCSENCIDLQCSSIAYCYQTRDWCVKYGLSRELKVTDWIDSLTKYPINFWVDNKDPQSNFTLLYNYVTNCCGLAIFFDAEKHPEWEEYIKIGYKNKVNIDTTNFKDLH